MCYSIGTSLHREIFLIQLVAFSILCYLLSKKSSQWWETISDFCLPVCITVQKSEEGWGSSGEVWGKRCEGGGVREEEWGSRDKGVYRGGAHRGQVQLFSSPRPITQAVVVLNQYNLYFWNLHCCMDKWCEEKNFQILMSLEKSMPNSRKNMYLLSYLLYICLHERRKTFSRKGLNLGRFYLNKTPSQVH